MTWFLERRIALADAVAAAGVGGVYLEHGLLPAVGAAAVLGILLSVGRALCRTR